MTNLKTGVSRKQSTPNFPKNEHFLPPVRTCAYQEVKNVRFSENLACFVFLKHLFLDLPFCLITYEFITIMVTVSNSSSFKRNFQLKSKSLLRKSDTLGRQGFFHLD